MKASEFKVGQLCWFGNYYNFYDEIGIFERDDSYKHKGHKYKMLGNRHKYIYCKPFSEDELNNLIIKANEDNIEGKLSVFKKGEEGLPTLSIVRGTYMFESGLHYERLDQEKVKICQPLSAEEIQKFLELVK